MMPFDFGLVPYSQILRAGVSAPCQMSLVHEEVSLQTSPASQLSTVIAGKNQAGMGFSGATAANPKPPAYERSKRNLLEVGFRQIGCSDYFENSDHLIQVDNTGTRQVLPESIAYFSNSPILAIRVSRMCGEKCIEGLQRVTGKLRGFQQGHHSSSNHVPRSHLRQLKRLRRLPAAKQLLKAGFTQDPRMPELFTLTDTITRRYTQTLMAIVINGKIFRCFYPHIAYYRIPPEGTMIKGTTLTYRNGVVETTIPLFGRERSKLLGPLDDVPLNVLNIYQNKPRTDETTGFAYYEVNSTDSIKNLAELNGISIAELEQNMRPSAFSIAGFLGPNESLLDVMAADNKWVLQQGLTHQTLANALYYMLGVAFRRIDGEDIIFHGQHYKVTYNRYSGGSQYSPFRDHLETHRDINVTNLENGKSIEFSGMLPDLIAKYGFYEGQGTRYRLSPQQIVEVFDFLVE